MKKRIFRVIAVSASLIFAGCAYAFLNSEFGFSIPCVFKKITGLECPGCGVTRMCLSILKLDYESAFAFNPVAMCMLPVGAVLAFCGVKRYIKTGVNHISKAENIIMWIMVMVLVVYGIVRNVL